MLIKDLPDNIRRLAMIRSREQFGDTFSNKCIFLSGFFIWENTPEGKEFWQEIDLGNFVEPIYSGKSLPKITIKLKNDLWKG
jgi:hypothetical protein